MIKNIQSPANEKIKYFNKLKDMSFSKKEGKFLIEGVHLVNMASKYLECAILPEESPEFKCDEYVVSNEILDKLSSGKSSARIIGVCNYKEEKEIRSRHLIYLNRVQDPGNVGTIFRTALAFNFKDIILDNECANKYNLKTIQSSQGSIFDLNIVTKNINYLKELKEQGYKIIVTTLAPDSSFLSDICNVLDKYVLVFGNEGTGVSKEIIDLADLKLKIKISNIDSLNVAISAGILMHHFANLK